MDELDKYASAEIFKYRLKCDRIGAFLSCPSIPQFHSRDVLFGTIRCNNDKRSDPKSFLHYNGPICSIGDDAKINGHLLESDFRTNVYDRVPYGPNFVMETQFRSRYSVLEFHRRLVACITGTANTMLVMGIKIFEYDQDKQFVALMVLHERGANHQPVVVRNVSFGSAEADSHIIANWTETVTQAIAEATAEVNTVPAAVPEMEGMGIDGFVPCTFENRKAPVYNVQLRADLMLCVNAEPPFVYYEGKAPDGSTYDVPLENIQRGITQAIARRHTLPIV